MEAFKHPNKSILFGFKCNTILFKAVKSLQFARRLVNSIAFLAADSMMAVPTIIQSHYPMDPNQLERTHNKLTHTLDLSLFGWAFWILCGDKPCIV